MFARQGSTELVISGPGGTPALLAHPHTNAGSTQGLVDGATLQTPKALALSPELSSPGESREGLGSGTL